MRFRLALAIVVAAVWHVQPAAAQYGRYAVPFGFGGTIGLVPQLQKQQYMWQQQQNLAHQQAGAAWSQTGQPVAQTWWYCDPARAYYPYVTTCSMPWRAVSPQSPTLSSSGTEASGPSMREPGPAATRDEYLAHLASLARQHLDLLPMTFIGDRRGETIINVLVLRDGTVSMLGVGRSSGYPDIDERIEQMIRAVGRFPPLPQWYQEPSMRLEFRLQFPEALEASATAQTTPATPHNYTPPEAQSASPALPTTPSTEPEAQKAENSCLHLGYLANGPYWLPSAYDKEYCHKVGIAVQNYAQSPQGQADLEAAKQIPAKETAAAKAKVNAELKTCEARHPEWSSLPEQAQALRCFLYDNNQ
jgi:TonB family protein